MELLAEKRNLLEAFRAGCKAAHGTADEILLKGLENALAYSKLQRRPAIDMKNPLTVDELREAWNAQADLANSWDNLGLDEIIEFAQQQFLARFNGSIPLPAADAGEVQS